MRRRPPPRRRRSPTPERTCIGCHRTTDASALVRVASDGVGGLLVGPSSGRGAWLCAGSLACFDAAARRRAFAKALRTEIAPEAVAALRERWNDCPDASGR